MGIGRGNGRGGKRAGAGAKPKGTPVKPKVIRGKNGGARPGAGAKKDPPLTSGEVGLAALVDIAIKRYGVDDPVVRMCLETHLRVARGGTHRYVGARLSSVNALLDRLVGRPPEAPPPRDPTRYSDVDRVIERLLGDEEKP